MQSFIVSFRSTTAAMQFLTAAEQMGLPGRVIPVPRQLASGCGLAWLAPLEAEEKILQALECQGISFGRTARMEYGWRQKHEKHTGAG